MHVKSRGPISVTAVLGDFEVYLVCSVIILGRFLVAFYYKSYFSMVELDAWKIYVSSGIDSDQIIAKCVSELKKESSEEPSAEAFTYKHRWICSSCYKNGQQVQRKNKSQYCSARAAHSWRDPIMMCHIGK